MKRPMGKADKDHTSKLMQMVKYLACSNSEQSEGEWGEGAK